MMVRIASVPTAHPRGNLGTAPARTYAAGWFYASAVVLVAQDILRIALFLGGAWIDGRYGGSNNAFGAALGLVALAGVGCILVRALAPALDGDADVGCFCRQTHTRWFALAALLLVLPLGVYEPGEPLSISGALLVGAQCLLDVLVLHDARRAVPRTKRPSVLLRAVLLGAVCSDAIDLLTFSTVAMLLRAVVALAAPSAEDGPVEVLDLEDDSVIEDQEGLGPSPQRVAALCGAFLAFVLARNLLDARGCSVSCVTGCVLCAIYLSMGRATVAMRLRALTAVTVGVIAYGALLEPLGAAWLSCTVAVLVLLSLVRIQQTATGLVAFVGAFVAAFWLMLGMDVRAIVEVSGPSVLVFTYLWQRYEVRERGTARHIRFYQ